jgi:hypothetical protein
MFVNGIPYSLPYPSNITSSFNFTAGSVTLPFSNEEFVTVTAPFSMTGGFHLPLDPPFTISGQGTASLLLRFYTLQPGGQQGYLFEQITYTFSPATPEPGSVILLTSGIFALAVKLKRRRIK